MSDIPKWLKEIQKEFGEDVLRTARSLEPRGYRGSGSLSLDIALGGGWGRRSFARLQGREGSGKTLLFDLAALEAQLRENKKSIIFDFEGTYDPARFVSLGGNINMMHIVDHSSVKEAMLFGEAAFDILKSVLVNSDDYACIGFDSTGAMVSRAEFEAKMEYGQGKATPFYTSRVMADGLKIVNGLIFKCPSEPTVFFVSQGRDNIAGASFKGMPPADKQTGGRALPFYASTIVEVRKGEIVKADVSDDETGQADRDVEIGHATIAKVKKNKLNGVQNRTAEFMCYTLGGVVGIDRYAELASLAIYTKVIKQSGSWFEMSNESVNIRVQGMAKLVEALRVAETFHIVDIQTRATLAKMMDKNAVQADDDESEEQ